jgi:hypothetical protein
MNGKMEFIHAKSIIYLHVFKSASQYLSERSVLITRCEAAWPCALLLLACRVIANSTCPSLRVREWRRSAFAGVGVLLRINSVSNVSSSVRLFFFREDRCEGAHESGNDQHNVSSYLLMLYLEDRERGAGFSSAGATRTFSKRNLLSSN